MAYANTGRINQEFLKRCLLPPYNINSDPDVLFAELSENDGEKYEGFIKKLYNQSVSLNSNYSWGNDSPSHQMSAHAITAVEGVLNGLSKSSKRFTDELHDKAFFNSSDREFMIQRFLSLTGLLPVIKYLILDSLIEHKNGNEQAYNNFVSLLNNAGITEQLFFDDHQFIHLAMQLGFEDMFVNAVRQDDKIINSNVNFSKIKDTPTDFCNAIERPDFISHSKSGIVILPKTWNECTALEKILSSESLHDKKNICTSLNTGLSKFKEEHFNELHQLYALINECRNLKNAYPIKEKTVNSAKLAGIKLLEYEVRKTLETLDDSPIDTFKTKMDHLLSYLQGIREGVYTQENIGRKMLIKAGKSNFFSHMDAMLSHFKPAVNFKSDSETQTNVLAHFNEVHSEVKKALANGSTAHMIADLGINQRKELPLLANDMLASKDKPSINNSVSSALPQGVVQSKVAESKEQESDRDVPPDATDKDDPSSQEKHHKAR